MITYRLSKEEVIGKLDPSKIQCHYCKRYMDKKEVYQYSDYYFLCNDLKDCGKAHKSTMRTLLSG